MCDTEWKLRESSRESFAKATLVTVAANAAIALQNFCTGIISARLLGQRGRGELAAIQTWPNFIAVFAMMESRWRS